ncbi:MAG: phage head morphogenesis protein [Clostridia bacterium]|nr:phage head morphogenesis protein [Clostridia bacterium]
MLSKNILYSTSWRTWKAMLDPKTCLTCRKLNGKIYDTDEVPVPNPPIHENGRCIIDRLEAKRAGLATKKGIEGADWQLKFHGELPEYYITVEEAKEMGWQPKLGDLAFKCPDKMIFGGIYNNDNGHLPSAEGRIWYEADINYIRGYRGMDRILFSNDGLIFVTYDHYHTFYEIV